MTDFLRDKLGFSINDKSEAGSIIGKVKGMAAFFADASEALGKSGELAAAIRGAVPWWAEAVGEAVVDTLPPLKFMLGLVANLTEEHEPDALGLLACTLAYQRAVESVLPTHMPQIETEMRGLRAELLKLDPGHGVTFAEFSFKHALEHKFTRQADQVLREFLTLVGCTDTQQSVLVARVHAAFVHSLKAILSHGKLLEKFAPFDKLISLDSADERARKHVRTHIQYQRWLLEQAPMFDREPFALEHIYVGAECGYLTWGQIKPGDDRAQTPGAQGGLRGLDPFVESDKTGGRHSLLEKVLELMGDPDLEEAIVVQGWLARVNRPSR